MSICAIERGLVGVAKNRNRGGGQAGRPLENDAGAYASDADGAEKLPVEARRKEFLTRNDVVVDQHFADAQLPARLRTLGPDVLIDVSTAPRLQRGLVDSRRKDQPAVLWREVGREQQSFGGAERGGNGCDDRIPALRMNAGIVDLVYQIGKLVRISFGRNRLAQRIQSKP